MKKLILAAGALLMPTAALADEGTAIDGFASIAAGYNSTEAGDWWNRSYYGEDSGTDSDKISGADFEVRGSVAVPISGALGAQVDGQFSRTYSKPNDCSECDREHSDGSTVAMHLYVRNPNKGLLGLVGQRTTRSSRYGSDATTWFVGGEGKLYMGRVTFTGQMAYASVESNNSNFRINGPFATIKLRYFPRDNLMVELRGSHGQLNGNPAGNTYYDCPDYCYSEKTAMWGIGGKAEYRLPGSRLSLFTQVDHRKIQYNEYYDDVPYFSYRGEKSTNLRAMVGIKFNFGASSLFNSDRSGAALDPIEPIDQVVAGPSKE